mmetsp:Transcript_21057/g.62851  ORF Transcript_21057/g.62851 Transcript_21057/m.62851 type:complete len:274 (-) Transcript_21057:691-1512(-)
MRRLLHQTRRPRPQRAGVYQNAPPPRGEDAVHDGVVLRRVVVRGLQHHDARPRHVALARVGRVRARAAQEAAERGRERRRLGVPIPGRGLGRLARRELDERAARRQPHAPDLAEGVELVHEVRLVEAQRRVHAAHPERRQVLVLGRLEGLARLPGARRVARGRVVLARRAVADRLLLVDRQRVPQQLARLDGTGGHGRGGAVGLEVGDERRALLAVLRGELGELEEPAAGPEGARLLAHARAGARHPEGADLRQVAEGRALVAVRAVDLARQG